MRQKLHMLIYQIWQMSRALVTENQGSLCFLVLKISPTIKEE